MSRLKYITLFLFAFFLTANAQDNNKKYEEHYNQTAQFLAKNLQDRIDLSDQQTEKVKDILIDYNRRVWNIKYNLVPAARQNPEEMKNENPAPAETTNVDTNPASIKTKKGYNDTKNNETPQQKKDEFKGTTAYDTVSYYSGLGRHEIEDLRDADRDADSKIVALLNGQQKIKYVTDKIDWWAIVKDKVYNTKYNTDLLGQPTNQQK